jgi:hypothetical protein
MSRPASSLLIGVLLMPRSSSKHPRVVRYVGFGDMYLLVLVRLLFGVCCLERERVIVNRNFKVRLVCPHRAKLLSKQGDAASIVKSTIQVLVL